MCEVEYAGGVRQVETDGEAGQVGQRVAEGGEFPVQQQWLAASGADEVARLEVVVQQLGFRVRVRGVEFAAEGCCGRGEVGGGGCVGVEPVMQAVAPVAVARGSGEPSGVGAWDAVNDGQGGYKAVQELAGGHGLGVDRALRGPRRCGLRVGPQVTRAI